MQVVSRKLAPSQADLEHAAEVRNASKSMAEAVRTLVAEWGDRGRVSRALGIRYQWVRNVMVAEAAKKRS